MGAFFSATGLHLDMRKSILVLGLLVLLIVDTFAFPTKGKKGGKKGVKSKKNQHKTKTTKATEKPTTQKSTENHNKTEATDKLDEVTTKKTVNNKKEIKVITKTKEPETASVVSKDEDSAKSTTQTKENLSEEEIYWDDDLDEPILTLPPVGKSEALVQDLKKLEDTLKFPLPSSLKDAVIRSEVEGGAFPQSERVMEEPRGESQATSMDRLPAAERVIDAQDDDKKPGGVGKMKMNLNLKDLDGDPTDLTIGAAAVGLMHQAVKSKGPSNHQVNAIAGFGDEIMSLINELEKDTEVKKKY